MRETTPARIVRLMLPRLPRLLVVSPLLVAVVTGSAALTKEGEITAWGDVKTGFHAFRADYERPPLTCVEQVRARLDQLEVASIFALRRRIDGDVPPDRSAAALRACVSEAVDGQPLQEGAWMIQACCANRLACCDATFSH